MLPEGNLAVSPTYPQKKRILFVITQSELGGAQQFLTQLLKHMNRDEFEPHLAVGSDGDGALRTLVPSDIPYMVVPSLKRDPSIVSDLRSIRDLRRIYRALKPDIVFLNSSKAGFNGSLAALGLPYRVIYRIGGWTFNDPWPLWKRRVYVLMEKISARWKDDIVVNSQKDLLDAQHEGIVPRNALHRISNGIDPYMRFLGASDARRALQSRVSQPALFKDGVYIIGTIANLYPPKGLTDLITATQFLPQNVVTVIIGSGALRTTLQDQITKQGLEQRVFLTGHIDAASTLIPGMDVFVLPSWKEGFPWAILEAMAARVPIVATRVGAVPEILENGKSGRIVAPKNPQELATAISQILDNEALRQEMPIQAHQKLLRSFNVLKMVEEYERLFRK